LYARLKAVGALAASPGRALACIVVLVLFAGVPTSAHADSLAELRIGYQKSSVNLLVARRLGLVERALPNTRVSWIGFTAGPQLLEALGAGSLDVGMTGDTPPVFAQAAGRDLLYVGVEPPKPGSSAILVPTGSAMTSIASLRGKRIAFQKGSSAHYLVLRALEKAGLQYSDIQPSYLTPADARAAFETGSVDAWAIWDPYWAAAEDGAHARVLTTGKGLSDNNTFYQSTRKFAQEHPQAIESLFAALNDADRYVHAHPGEAYTLIASATGLDVRVAKTFLDRRGSSPVSALSPSVIATQQIVADTFARAGLIPHPIKIEAAVWRSVRSP
jgi:sulfonate transport system substrate-binding protein